MEYDLEFNPDRYRVETAEAEGKEAGIQGHMRICLSEKTVGPGISENEHIYS